MFLRRKRKEPSKWEGDITPIITPDLEYLDQRGFEYVGFRKPTNGDYFITQHLEISNGTDNIEQGVYDGKRWILKIKDSSVNP